MKIVGLVFVTIMMVLNIADSFARAPSYTCPPPHQSVLLLGVAQTAEGMACLATRAEYKCEKLEADLEGDEKNKIIKCDSKSLEANKLSNMSFGDCIWNGLKMSGESLVDLAGLPSKIAGGIAQGFKETQICNSSIEKKREILNAFNLTIEDSRFKLSEQFLGRWLEDAGCGEIEKLVSARYTNYQNTMARERQAALITGKKVAPIKSPKDGPGLAEMLKGAMAQATTAYECYTPKVKAEMICAGVTSLLADAALGGGVMMAAKKMSAIVKSKKALARIERATAAGGKADLADAGVLLNGDRLKGAQLVLQRSVTEAEKKAILEAHEIGLKEGRGFYTYTKDDILKKARILREAGFSQEQTRALMENGVTGFFRNDAVVRSAMLKHFEKVVAVSLTATQQEAMVVLHELGRSSAVGYLDKAKALLKEAKFSDEQIAKILKAKANEENGIKTVVAAVPEKKPIVSSATPEVKAPEVAKPQVAAPVVDSPGRKAVLSNFKNDPVIDYKTIEIPEGLTGEALIAKQNAKAKNAQAMMQKLAKGDKHYDIQNDMLNDAEAVFKSKKSIAELEEKLAKLPAKGSDAARKDIADKMDRSKTSYEMYQKRCKGLLEIYREAYGIPQYLNHYEKIYQNQCK